MSFFKQLFGSTPSRPSYKDAFNATGDEIEFSLDTPAPFKLKRGEIVVHVLPTILYTYRTNANVGFAIASQRVKLWKGASIRIGGGKAARGKSWLPEDTGTVYITNNRVVFIGSVKNRTQLHSKILKIDYYDDGMGILVQRDNGPDWRFIFEHEVSPRKLRAILVSGSLTKEMLTS